ncbi:MAG: indolepyruvate oxidoreductase subunit beta [Acutalibacteraceae bacterium]|nr:indolepyruvate oxidoreductase subunit beta [Eubacteriales bacterium]MEE1300009.1 indolepyruvate oxidoreductase subunit beta [Acutalibacteraceae bacterium]MEE3312345.1 indolepyruvate oxidoreductase subunit beta [Acutalibacteraceae bacterium]
MTNIVLCGIGGQGTVLASKLLAAAGMKKGYTVQSAETIGMAQRGGSVFSHLRMGAADEEVSSPMIALGTADILIGFEPGETVRLLPYLKPDGQVITASRSVMPVTAALTGGSYDGADMLRYLEDNVRNLSVVDTETALAELGNPKVTNVLLLGYAAESGALGLTAEDLKEALKERLPEKLWDVNFKALDYAKKA